MQLAEMREHDLRARASARPSGPDGTRPAPRASAAPCAASKPSAASSATTSALASNTSAALAVAGPMAAGARERRGAGAHAGGGDELILGRVAAIGLAELEQRRRRQSRGRGCAAPPSSRPGSRLGRIDDISRRDRIGELELSLRRRRTCRACLRGMNDQVMASTRPRAGEHAPRAARRASGVSVSTGARHAGRARHRRRRHLDRGRRCARPPRRDRRARAMSGRQRRRRHLDGFAPCRRARSRAPRASR